MITTITVLCFFTLLITVLGISTPTVILNAKLGEKKYMNTLTYLFVLTLLLRFSATFLPDWIVLTGAILLLLAALGESYLIFRFGKKSLADGYEKYKVRQKSG